MENSVSRRTPSQSNQTLTPPGRRRRKLMNRFAFFALAAILVGCSGKSTQINTPRVDITDDDDHRTVNSVGRYEKCKEDLMQFLPKDPSHPLYANWLLEIEQKCYNRTANVGGAGSLSGELAMVPMGGSSFPGMNAPTNPGFYSGMPGAQPIVITPSSGVWVQGPSSEDTELLVKSQRNQEKRLCELEKQAGRPCKKN